MSFRLLFRERRRGSFKNHSMPFFDLSFRRLLRFFDRRLYFDGVWLWFLSWLCCIYVCMWYVMLLYVCTLCMLYCICVYVVSVMWFISWFLSTNDFICFHRDRFRLHNILEQDDQIQSTGVLPAPPLHPNPL